MARVGRHPLETREDGKEWISTVRKERKATHRQAKRAGAPPTGGSEWTRHIGDRVERDRTCSLETGRVVGIQKRHSLRRCAVCPRAPRGLCGR